MDGSAGDTGLLELAERCEKATGPDRELDILIGYAVDLKGDDANLLFRRSFDICGMAQTLQMAESHQNIWRSELPRYTASIDAATTLVPEGWHLILYTENCTAELYDAQLKKRAGIRSRSQAETPALAICAAALRARQTLTATESKHE